MATKSNSMGRSTHPKDSQASAGVAPFFSSTHFLQLWSPASKILGFELVNDTYRSILASCVLSLRSFFFHYMNLELKSGTTLDHGDTEQIPTLRKSGIYLGKKKYYIPPPPCPPLPKINKHNIYVIWAPGHPGERRLINSTWGVCRKIWGRE